MKIALPSDNKPLTQTEFDFCRDVIDYYVGEGKYSLPYCVERGVDPSLVDRGNVWQGGFVDHIGQMLAAKSYNNINRLRLIGWHFSGYRVFDLAGCTEPPANEWFQKFYNGGIAELPDDVDSIVTAGIDPARRIKSLTHRLFGILHDVDHKYLFGQPLRFGEIAGDYQGYWVNGDSVRYWSTSAVLYKARVFEHLERKIAERGFCTVVEIGSGYGGLGYQLKSIYGDKLRFVAVDLVQSLIFSAMYMCIVLKSPGLFYQQGEIPDEMRLVFVPTFRTPEFFAGLRDVDLCVNTVSMNEMSPAQVHYYGQQIARVLASDGLFLECNWMAAVAGPGRIDVKSYLALHFNHRLSVEASEMASDGNLDFWAKGLPPGVEDAVQQQYSVTHYARG